MFSTITCPGCKAKVNKTANFCQFCQYDLRNKKTASVTCPRCGGECSDGANFCTNCGFNFKDGNINQHATAVVANNEANLLINKNYVTWQMLPGQLAVKIDEFEIQSYKTIKGVYVAPGTKAYFFVNGKYAGELESNTYDFSDIMDDGDEETKSHPIGTFIKNIGRFLSNGILRLFGDKPNNYDKPKANLFSIVLARGTEFPLLYSFDGVRTADFRCSLGISFTCKITNLNSFFETMLVDTKMVAIKTLADRLRTTVFNVCSNSLRQISANDIKNNPELNRVIADGLHQGLNEIYPFVAVTNVIDLTAHNDKLEILNRNEEELYIEEKKLEQLQIRNDFLNRLQSVERSNALRNARDDADYRALLDEVDMQNMMTDDKKAQFAEALRATAMLRTATSENDKYIALNKLEQSKLLSDEEIAILKKDIAGRSDIKDVENQHALSLATLQSEIVLKREKRLWDVEELKFRAEEDDYRLDKMRKEASLASEIRDDEYAHQKRKMDDKLDIYQQITKINMEKDDAAHRRDMDKDRLDKEYELEKLKLQGQMSPEQLIATLKLDPENAKVFMTMYQSKNNQAAQEQLLNMALAHGNDFKALAEKVLDMNNGLMANQSTYNERMLSMKDEQISRTERNAERHQDRMLDGVKTTVGAFYNQSPAPMANPIQKSGSKFCPKCGTACHANAVACSNCGSTF